MINYKGFQFSCFRLNRLISSRFDANEGLPSGQSMPATTAVQLFLQFFTNPGGGIGFAYLGQNQMLHDAAFPFILSTTGMLKESSHEIDARPSGLFLNEFAHIQIPAFNCRINCITIKRDKLYNPFHHY
jgi:hypothetical protein